MKFPASKRGQKEKREKDPNQPKRPFNAYMFFAKDKRQGLREACPYWGVAEIGRETGALWRRLISQQKRVYEDMAAQDKQRYEEEMTAYRGESSHSNQASHNHQPRHNHHLQASLSNQSKRPMGAYMLFAVDARKELREDHPEWGLAEVGRETGAMWKMLTDRRKQKYAALAAQDKKRYEEEMRASTMRTHPRVEEDSYSSSSDEDEEDLPTLPAVKTEPVDNTEPFVKDTGSIAGRNILVSPCRGVPTWCLHRALG